MSSCLKLVCLCLASAGISSVVTTSAVQAANAQIWHVKAIDSDGTLLDVKAIDGAGQIHNVKAIQQSGNRHVLDIKAFVDGEVLPVKVLQSDQWPGPVKAIASDGTILDIKALTPEGDHLDVKAVSQSGSILDIKAISPEGRFLGIKAISPDGHVYDIKGMKMLDEPVEQTIGGVEVRAHIKALPQVP